MNDLLIQNLHRGHGKASYLTLILFFNKIRVPFGRNLLFCFAKANINNIIINSK